MAMPDQSTPDVGASTELERYSDELGMDRLRRAPIIDRIDPRQLDLIRSTIGVSEDARAHPITNAELGMFLELCAHYDLEWAAREAWIAKSKTGKLLIMVGRAGLRKVADRNGLRVRTDVICSKDEFASAFVQSPADLLTLGILPSGTPWAVAEYQFEVMGGGRAFHHVTHKKHGITSEQRGHVAGAWSRVTVRNSNVEAGYFDAPISEYKPANVSTYSPWAKQESAMMQGAVERQAIAQATPLGGLHAQGEDESANTAQTVLGAGQGSGEGPGWGDIPAELIRGVMNVIERARELGHVGLSAVDTIQQRLNGQSFEYVAKWIGESNATLDEMAENVAKPEPEITDAEIVPDAPADEFTLSFGGETFTFNDTDTYGHVADALAGGPSEMTEVAIVLGAAGNVEMAQALHREAQERDGQTELDV